MELKNIDRLAQRITSNILDKLSVKTTFDSNKKSCLVVTPTIGIGLNAYDAYIAENYPQYNIYISKEHHVPHTKSNMIEIDFSNKEFNTLLDTVDQIIVLGLKISQMRLLLETDDSQDMTHVILSSLMANKPVTALINTNASLYNKISPIIKEIQAMGIKVINIQSPKLSREKELPSNELITENYVINLGKRGIKELTLAKNQLITPLAKDKLRALRIEVQYVKEAN